jgi:hypothetical protein
VRRLLAALVVSVNVALAADAPRAGGLEPDPWQPLRFLLGRWEGAVQGESGNGTVVRSYEFMLGNRFIEERNVSTYPAQAKNRKGEVHEHRGFFSYDKLRRKLVLRQFHQEGFVNTYVFNPAESTSTVLVFDSESFENLDSGFKARETYEVYSSDEFIETFEVAEPGKALDLYSRTRFTRVGRAAG